MADLFGGQRDEMLAVNVAQRRYYEVADGHSASSTNGFATNAWRKVRSRALSAVPACADDLVYGRHRQWIGSLSGLKVLELGCGRGTPLSDHLAASCRSYHAIDLSSANIAVLSARLSGIPSATFHVGDVLAPEFGERHFDLIYAHSVLHHFRHLETACARLDSLMAPAGRLITYDPIQTWLPARAVRALYRPFQSDRDWEFPFGVRALDLLQSRYQVLDQFGMFDRCKWALAIGVLCPAIGRRLGSRWFGEDLESTASDSRRIGSCLRVSFHLTHPSPGARAT
jgi:2-polyprenyl-3-methyl-5-hydroxy-6-metoxy-1,4-benzoquinol methylase